MSEFTIDRHQSELIGFPLIAHLRHQKELLRYFTLLLAHGNEPEVSAVFGRNSFSFRVYCEHSFLFRLRCLVFLLLLAKFLALPGYLLTVPAPILNEQLLYSRLVSVYCTEIKSLEVLVAIYRRTNSFGFQYHVLVLAILHYEM